MIAQNAPETPLVSTGPADEVDAFFIPSKLNFVADKAVRAWIDDNLLPMLQQGESDGTAVRDEWERIRDMLYLRHGEDQGYKGESNSYLPAYAKASDVRTSHINRALFPTDSVVDVMREGDEGDADLVKSWMQYQMEVEMKIRLGMKKHIRTLNDFGFAVSKVFWHKPPAPDKATRLRKVPGLGLFGDLSAADTEGARFLPRDIFGFYIWPTTIDTPEQASLLYEIMQVSKQDADLRFKSGEWLNEDEAGFPDIANEYSQDLQQQADLVLGGADIATEARSRGELGTWGYVKECWLRMPVPASLYGPGEVKGAPVPVKVVLVNDVPVEACRNPFWHQKPPYVISSPWARPGQIYGTGLGRMGLELQGLINDTMNQTQDNVTYGLNPMAIINPNTLVGNSSQISIKPGGVINSLDPNGVKWDRPPVEQMQYGNQQLSSLMSMMNDLLGTPPIVQGTGSKGAGRTATGSQILQNNVKTDMQDVVEDLELSVLVPTMQMVYMLGQQYEKNERWLAITGGEPIRFTRDAFVGRYKFKWLASSQAMNQQVRAQQALQFLQLISSPPLMQLLMQQGKMVNPEPLLRLLYETGIGGRDFAKILIPAPMPMGMPGAPGLPPGAAPPGVGPLGGDPRSAVEQAPGGSGEMAPGEGEDFAAIRGEADMMAAEAGAAGGFGLE